MHRQSLQPLTGRMTNAEYGLGRRIRTATWQTENEGYLGKTQTVAAWPLDDIVAKSLTVGLWCKQSNTQDIGE
ncbi:hypothetical protein AVEN_204689-1 [Araneus ventricosus]|uniref:Uncharacterized protein n=1 Tax=Araneus ventricosus TaxID=182803 RepID=A0A4Y2GGH7_ARAVE|nr:hypothetical protein AVEN_204689-1 [Araneus ventricosus]